MKRWDSFDTLPLRVRYTLALCTGGDCITVDCFREVGLCCKASVILLLMLMFQMVLLVLGIESLLKVANLELTGASVLRFVCCVVDLGQLYCIVMYKIEVLVLYLSQHLGTTYLKPRFGKRLSH